MWFEDDTRARFYALLSGLMLVLVCALATRRAVERGAACKAGTARVEPPHMRPDPRALEDLARELDRQVQGGALSLGHALLMLDHAERQQIGERRVFDLERVTRRYDQVLVRARELAIKGRLGAVAGVVRALEEGGFRAYNRVNARISDGLTSGAANCEGTTHLLVSLLADLGLSDRVFIRAYSNHVSPELVDGGKSRHFGLINGCPGPGRRLAAGELLSRFRAGRPDARGHFEYPASKLSCADPGLLFDPEPPIVVHDSHGRLWHKASRSPKGCAYPRPEMVKSSDQYEAHGEHGAVLVERVVVDKARLAEHSQKIACTETLLATRLVRDEDRLPFLGAAAGLYQQAAVLYAAAGLESVVDELSRRQQRVVDESERILAGVDWNGASGQRLLRELSVRDSWPLKFLGDRGRDVLLKMAKKHEADYVLSVLVRDGATRARALEIAAARPAAEQLEILGGLDLENPWFFEEFSADRQAQQLLGAHRVSLALAERWRSCTLEDLIVMATREVDHARLGREWLAPIVIRLGMHRVAARCPELGDKLLKFAVSRAPKQAAQVKNELRIIRMMQ